MPMATTLQPAMNSRLVVTNWNQARRSSARANGATTCAAAAQRARFSNLGVDIHGRSRWHTALGKQSGLHVGTRLCGMHIALFLCTSERPALTYTRHARMGGWYPNAQTAGQPRYQTSSTLAAWGISLN
jgi:hypothetical protein